MRGTSHVVFGLAGAAVIDGMFHLSGAPLLGASAPPTTDQLAQKLIFYAFAALGALTPDIDNARSTLGKRMGVVSKGIQHIAGHRTLLHSFLGLGIAAVIVWGVQYGLGVALYHAGLTHTGAALGVGLAPGGAFMSGLGIAFVALLVGYFLHLVADSLTEGGVPWLWPSHARYGFPPNRHWRFKTGSTAEPIVVVAVSVAVIIAIWAGKLAF